MVMQEDEEHEELHSTDAATKRAEAADNAMASTHADQNEKRRQLMLLPSPAEAVRHFHFPYILTFPSAVW